MIDASIKRALILGLFAIVTIAIGAMTWPNLAGLVIGLIGFAALIAAIGYFVRSAGALETPPDGEPKAEA